MNTEPTNNDDLEPAHPQPVGVEQQRLARPLTRRPMRSPMAVMMLMAAAMGGVGGASMLREPMRRDPREEPPTPEPQKPREPTSHDRERIDAAERKRIAR